MKKMQKRQKGTGKTGTGKKDNMVFPLGVSEILNKHSIQVHYKPNNTLGFWSGLRHFAIIAPDLLLLLSGQV